MLSGLGTVNLTQEHVQFMSKQAWHKEVSE